MQAVKRLYDIAQKPGYKAAFCDLSVELDSEQFHHYDRIKHEILLSVGDILDKTVSAAEG